MSYTWEMIEMCHGIVAEVTDLLRTLHLSKSGSCIFCEKLLKPVDVIKCSKVW